MKGLVLKSTGSWYNVQTPTGDVVLCKIKGSLRLAGSKGTNPVAIGDWVDIDQTGSTGQIVSICERKNYIIRKSSNLSRQYHILAANIDQAMLLVTLSMPQTPPEFTDRFLATAEAYSIHTHLVFNKTDLYDGDIARELDYWIKVYSEIGYPCHTLSVLRQEGLDNIKQLLQGKVTFISGNSGVGKTSLINLIEPGLNLKVAGISDYHLKGKHTTTFYEMFNLSMGGYIIDSPGIKGFGMVDMKKEEIFHFYREIFKTAVGCQFNNCLHLNEPGCAVKKEVKDGRIAPSRYRSYLSMLLENEGKYR